MLQHRKLCLVIVGSLARSRLVREQHHLGDLLADSVGTTSGIELARPEELGVGQAKSIQCCGPTITWIDHCDLPMVGTPAEHGASAQRQ
jgi:hypothetical protein